MNTEALSRDPKHPPQEATNPEPNSVLGEEDAPDDELGADRPAADVKPILTFLGFGF